MKNIFGLNDDNENFDGYSFLLREISPALNEKFENQQTDNLDFFKRASLSKPLIVIKYICFFISICFLIGILNALGDVTLKEAYQNAPYLFYIGGVSLIILILLLIYEKKKKTNIEESKEFIDSNQKGKELIQEAIEELKIPANSDKIDVFLYHYKIKNGKEKLGNTLQTFQYINFEFNVFIEDNKLCFSDNFQVIAIPLSSITKIRELNKKVSFFGWNKEEQYNKGEYKQYKIKQNSNLFFFIKTYYSIIINDYYGDYEILVPGYEINKILKLTNLEIEKEEN